MYRYSRSILKYCFALVLCLIFNISSAQNFERNKDTSQLVNSLNFAKELVETNPDSALSLFEVAEMESIKAGDNKSLMISCFNQAYILFRKGQHRESLSLFQKTVLLSEELNNKFHLYASKVYMGAIYMLMASYNLALTYNLEGLAYFEKVKDYSMMSGIYLNLTFIQVEQRDLTKALEYTDLSYKYAKLAENEIYESKSLLNFGEIYYEQKEYAKALIYYNESLQISEKNNFSSFTPIIYLNKGSTFLALNQFDSAEICFKYVIEKESKPYFKSLGILSYAELNEQNKNYDKALEFALAADEIASRENLGLIRKRANTTIARMFEKKGNYKKAYEYKVVSEIINDSIFSDEKYRIQNELETVYENAKKEKKIEELSKEKQINELKAERFEYILFFLLFIVLIIVLVGSLIFRQNKQKAKHESIELEQKLLRLQMNPHFIFNSISGIQDFILDNNPLEASSYLSDFAKLMRVTLTNSSDNFIPLRKEIETIEHYLKLQHLRLSDKFEYEITISNEIDKDEYSVPPMLMQPFIENSIIHGILKKKDGKGLIKLSYSLNNGSLILEATDNGIGRALSKQNTLSKHKSMAIDITNQRINLLSKKYKQSIRFEILDLKDNHHKSSGTLVRFTLPIQ